LAAREIANGGVKRTAGLSVLILGSSCLAHESVEKTVFKYFLVFLGAFMFFSTFKNYLF
jgi:hypothetical protein